MRFGVWGLGFKSSGLGSVIRSAHTTQGLSWCAPKFAFLPSAADSNASMLKTLRAVNLRPALQGLGLQMHGGHASHED